VNLSGFPSLWAQDYRSENGDEDLLDLAAIQTLTNRGQVYVIPQGEMPGQALAAAILRY
jgi:hypothetical protein